MLLRAALTTLLASCAAFAELPIARLQSIFPAGGQSGTVLEVKVQGADLDDAAQLRFTGSGIRAQHHPSNAPDTFSVTIDSSVAPGLYEARVLGRFGLSNPRYFVVGSAPEFAGSATNHTAAAAQSVTTNCTINAVATAAAADFYRFEAASGQRLLISCLGEPFDSKMRPRLLLYDAEGRELARDRTEGALEFQAPAAGAYCIKVHDEQFRGGPQFSYRLTISGAPQTRYLFPPARTPGADRRFTAFGFGLGKAGAAREITVPKKTEVQSHAFHAPRLADCAVNSFDFREEAENPVEIAVATAPAVLEQEPNNDAAEAQQISVPCEIQGQFFPRGDVDIYEFTARKGEVFTIEAFSERLGLTTDPFVLVQQIRTNASGTAQAADLHEMYDSDPNIGGPLFDTSSRDPSWRLEVPEDGRFRVRIHDLFNYESSPSRVYRLSIRRESPDFQLIATIAPPPSFDKDKREAQVWSAVLRQGGTLPVKVLALRRDQFKGDIRLELEGAPAGIHASESIIPSGQNSAWLTLSADAGASEWAGAVRIVGKSGELARTASAATILWDVPDYNNETVKARLTQETTLSVLGEPAPLRLASTNAAWQAAQNAALAISWNIERSSEFKEPVKLRAYLDGQNDPLREWDVDAAAAQASLELDLKQAKIPAGRHDLLLLAQTKGKIRRVRPDEVGVLQAAEKRAKDDAEKKRIAERLKLHDTTAIFCAPLVTLIVHPPATAAK